MMKNYIYLILIFSFYACKQERKTEINTSTNKSQKSNQEKVVPKARPNTHDFSSIKKETNVIVTKPSEQEFQILKTEEDLSDVYYENPIESKYVISRNGLNIRNANGTVDDKLNNGDFVKILGYTDEIKNNGELVKGRWAIIKWGDISERRYVFDAFLGNIEDVKVYKDQICIGFYLESENRYNSDKKLKCLTKYFDFELISEHDYNSINTIISNHLRNNPLVKIEDNEDETQNITLPLKDSLIVFKSEVNYSSSAHRYLGDVDFLNQYVTHHTYFKAEDDWYAFIDRTTGEETYTFSAFPNISPDKKQIISFYEDVYEERFFLQICNINDDNSIEVERVFEFIHWLEIAQNKMKWISNKEFVITIANKNIWNGSTVKKPQYLKIKLKI